MFDLGPDRPAGRVRRPRRRRLPPLKALRPDHASNIAAPKKEKPASC
jgi:hypothetical protein